MIPAAEPETAASTWPARIAAGASIVVHVAAVAFFLGYAGAGAYQSAPEAVPVSVVTPEEAAQEPPPPPEEKLDLRPSLDNTTPPDPLMQPPQAEQQPDAPSRPAQAQQQPAPPAAQQKLAAAPAAPPPQQAPAQPAYTPPAPDISLQYGIDLGLKDLSMAAAPVDTPRDGASDFDEVATSKAQIDRASIGAFRAKLRECAALPPQVAPDDKVVIVMRATFTQDARLAAEPTLIEASASAKGPLLMQAAIKALQACQPHNALPADKYTEWRVLDLRFTPQDFRRG